MKKHYKPDISNKMLNKQETLELLKQGAELHWHFTFGAWIVHNGESKDVNLNSAKSIKKDDLVVVKDCFEPKIYYSFRIKS